MTSEGARSAGAVARRSVVVVAGAAFDAAVSLGLAYLVLGVLVVLWAFGPDAAGASRPSEHGGPGLLLVFGGALMGPYALAAVPWVAVWALAANALRAAAGQRGRRVLRLALALAAAVLLVTGVIFEVRSAAADDGSGALLPFGRGMFVWLGFAAAGPFLALLGRDLLVGLWAFTRGADTGSPAADRSGPRAESGVSAPGSGSP